MKVNNLFNREEFGMFIRFLYFLLSLLACQNIYAAGPACFNYETYEHQGPAAGANNALLNYDHAMIAVRNIAIPVLAPGALQPQISLFDVVAGGPWDHTISPNLGGGLTYQEACMMALERQGIGITVRFQHFASIQAIALGTPLPMVAMGFPGGLVGLTQYLDNALGGGGYRPTVLAVALYRLRNNLPYPNFVALPMGLADTVLIHFHSQIRVSKNVKELSYNSILNIAGYHSIKDIIDAIYNVIGLPPPHSATVLSSDNLQLH